jgi:hypothetical protein
MKALIAINRDERAIRRALRTLTIGQTLQQAKWARALLCESRARLDQPKNCDIRVL